MCTPALPNPIPAVEAASLLFSCAKASYSLGYWFPHMRCISLDLQHLRASLFVAERIISNTRQVLDGRLERPAGKDIREGVRALVSGCYLSGLSHDHFRRFSYKRMVGMVTHAY